MTAVAGQVSYWEQLEYSALEKGLLDGVDIALIGTLTAASGRGKDSGFPFVLGALITAVRAGSIRIPLDPDGLAMHLQAFIESVRFSSIVNEQEASRITNLVAQPNETLEPIPVDTAGFSAGLTRNFLIDLDAGAYQSVMGKAGDFVPLIRTEGGLYFQKYHAAEVLAGARLNALLAAPDLDLSKAAIQDLLGTVLDRLPLRLSHASEAPAMEFDPRQKEALALAIRKRFTVISGGPGTGKTSLAANLLRAWTRAWIALHGTAPRIRLAAPTGRAAQRLSESIRRSLETIRPGAPQSHRGSESDTASDPAFDSASVPASDLASVPDKAADMRVRELECSTLHSLLRYNPGTGGYGHHAHRPLPADLILIDEVSMVDIFTLARVLDAMEEGAGLILLGDMDQLPSVEAGSVLADLVPRPGDPNHPLRDNLIILDRSHRSEARILEVARRINAKQGTEALAAMGTPLSLGTAAAPGTEGGCRMLLPSTDSPATYRAGWPAWLNAWIDFHYLDPSHDAARFPGIPLAPSRRASYSTLIADLCALPSPDDPRRDGWLEQVFAYLDQARILTFTRKGWHGAVNINRRIRERIGRRWDPRAPIEGEGGFAGSPLLILENDHGKGLFNGDVGIQLRIQGRDLAFFRRGEAYLGFAAAFLPRHETAFAMTIHKSQGSEYDYALVVLPETGNRLLYKETLYTALTRARRFAGIYGPEATFLEAVSRNVVRESGLAESLVALRR